jgi:hypothetical protein
MLFSLGEIEVSFLDEKGNMFGSCYVLDGKKEEGYLHVDRGNIHKEWPDRFYVMGSHPSHAPNHSGVDFNGEIVTIFKDKRRGRIYKIARVMKPEGDDESYITKRFGPVVDGERPFEHACIGPTRLKIDCIGTVMA